MGTRQRRAVSSDLIKLFYQTGASTQAPDFEVDAGKQHIGIAVTEGIAVLHRTDTEFSPIVLPVVSDKIKSY